MEEPIQGLPCARGDHHGLHGLRNGLYGVFIIDLMVVREAVVESGNLKISVRFFSAV